MNNKVHRNIFVVPKAPVNFSASPQHQWASPHHHFNGAGVIHPTSKSGLLEPPMSAPGGGTLVDISPNFWPLVEVFFSQKWVIFQNFRDTYTNITPNFFIAVLLTNFQKSAQKLFAAPSAPRPPPLFLQFLSPC